MAGDVEVAAISSGTTTKLHIEISASERTSLKISLEGISTMEELQELVAEVSPEYSTVSSSKYSVSIQ